jgi:hypothetical protein
LAGKSEIYII